VDAGLYDALLNKALTSASDSGGAWQDHIFNPILTDAAKKKRPILEYLNIRPANGNPHVFRRRDSMPYMHWQGAAGTPVATQSGVSGPSVNLKVCTGSGAVESFLISTIGPDNFDVALAEVMGFIEGTAMQVSASVLWGDAGLSATGVETSGNGNIYMPPGLDADTGIMRINGAGAALTDALFQKLLDTTNVAGMTGKRFAIMSSMMASRLEAVTQSLGARYMVDEEGLYGRRIKKYRDCYILESDQTRPRAVMGAISCAGSDGSGTLSNGTYYYYVAPVTAEGEQLRQAAEADVTLAAGTATQKVTITITAFQFSDTNALYADAVYYKIYRGTGTGAEVLVATVPALSYSSGTVSGADTTLVDDGTADTRGGVTGSLPGGVSSADDELTGTVTAPEECIFLVNADPADGIEIAASANKSAQAIGDNDLFGLVRLGKSALNEPFAVGSFVAPVIKRGACHGVLRRVLAA